MKKINLISCSLIVFVCILTTNFSVYAKVGDSGFFGGISSGRRLPKTTESLLEVSNNKSDTFEYKETIFLSGVPTDFEGTLTVTSKTPDFTTAPEVGTYKESYEVKSSSATDSGVSLNRKIDFTVNYRIVDNQIIKDYTATKWTETITTAESSFTLDSTLSHFDISIIEDIRPGVTYYKGDISQKAVYTGGTGSDNTIHDVYGSFYGYSSPYSSTETHRLNGIVSNDQWQMSYQVRPSVTVDKTIMYGDNEPQLISFSGNYKEVIKNNSGLMYDIFMKPTSLYYIENSGRQNIAPYNVFEQLIAPRMEFLNGHFAETDIRKLFAMQILEGDPAYYIPNQAVTRAQYVTMLAKAIKLDTSKYQSAGKTVKSSKTVNIVFPDMNADRPDYPYIMAAYDAGLAVGRDNGHYYPDSPITREEALVILLRTLGLENLGLDPTPVTTFVDDNEISDWAKKEIYAAQRINLISGDDTGRINPQSFVSKGEAAALTNRLIDYMRVDMQQDYGQNIVHFAD